MVYHECFHLDLQSSQILKTIFESKQVRFIHYGEVMVAQVVMYY